MKGSNGAYFAILSCKEIIAPILFYLTVQWRVQQPLESASSPEMDSFPMGPRALGPGPGPRAQGPRARVPGPLGVFFPWDEQNVFFFRYVRCAEMEGFRIC